MEVSCIHGCCVWHQAAISLLMNKSGKETQETLIDWPSSAASVGGTFKQCFMGKEVLGCTERLLTP